MPKTATTRVTDRVQFQPASPREGVSTEVAARQVDFLSGATPRPSSDLDGLLNGLSTFNGALKDYAGQKADGQNKEGRHSRARGETLDEAKGAAFVNGYMALDGYIKGEQDRAEFEQRWATQFDKDNGDPEKFISEFMAEKTKGVPQGAWTDGYNEVMSPALVKMRSAHVDYQRNRVVSTYESNAVQLLTGGIGAYIQAGQPVPDEYRTRIKEHLGSDLGVSATRFDELEFAAIKRLGDEGNFAIYDMLKRDRPDGQPGLYFDPAWKEKIDQAQLHATNIYLNKQSAAENAAEKAREEALDRGMLDIFLEEDPKQAARMFQERRHLFTRTSDYVKYEKLLTEKVDGKPSVDQLDVEVDLLPRALRGGLPLKEILAANLTRSQKMGLINKNQEAINEAKRLRATNAANATKWYSSPEFRSAETFLEQVLHPRPTKNLMTGIALPGSAPEGFDRTQLARAKVDLFHALKNGDVTKAQETAQAIADRYLKQRTGLAPSQQSDVAAGNLPFKTPGEAATALRRGLISREEAEAYANYFESQGK